MYTHTYTHTHMYVHISVARKCVIYFLWLLFREECFILEEEGGLVGLSDGQKDTVIYSKYVKCQSK